MRILVDIVHPADVLFFFKPIRKWQQLGHAVCVASRNKDVTEALLDAFDIEHRSISKAGDHLLSLALELIKRDIALLRLARDFRPDVMCGFGGVAIAHVGRFTGIPSVSFYDTERAPLQHKITLPFISHLYVPNSYDGPVAKDRTTRFPGTKDFSYLHPDNFAPDRTIALAAGLAQGRKNFFIRIVRWSANHDIGHHGWDTSTLREFILYLAGRGQVHLSSESELPPDLQAFQYSGPVHHVHHLLAYCNCYIGESATMAGEAALLGVPGVYAANDRRCYTDELAGLGLLWKINPVDFESLRLAWEEISQLDRREWQERSANYRHGKLNLADYIVDATLHHGAAG
jgi:predicted glycosyltransferase